MKYKGSTVTVTVTVPKHQIDQVERLLKYAVDGYECTVVPNTVERKPYKPETLAKQANIVTIRSIASELGVLKRNREGKIVVIRTSLVYYLLKHFNAYTISRAFGWDHTTVKACRDRYEALKHYADYEEATATVSQCLKRHSLVD